jgi:prepilin-type N-terminal cleavage/methylation domain-containing protein/prepilin-type processing-associated H-X9-DG protein
MLASRNSSFGRGGFTLLELLVVIAIIAVLLAITVPAIQKARETAYKLQCSNNLHQIGLALDRHFSTQRYFPTNGAIVPANGVRFAGPPTIYYQYGLSTFPSAQYMWGMGDPTQGPKSQTGSWAFSILPYLDANNEFGNDSRVYGFNGNYATAVQSFMCPSRGRLNPQPFTQTWTPPPSNPPPFSWQPTTPATTPLPNNSWSKTDYAANYLAMPDITDPRFLTTGLRPFGGSRNYPIAPDDITDGSSNTIVVGEKALTPDYKDKATWYWDEPIFSGGSGGTSRGVPSSVIPTTTNVDPLLPFYSALQGFAPGSMAFNYPSTVLVDTDASAGTFENNWGSPHRAGVNFLFADGSVRTFGYSMDPTVLQALLTPAGVAAGLPKEGVPEF